MATWIIGSFCLKIPCLVLKIILQYSVAPARNLAQAYPTRLQLQALKQILLALWLSWREVLWKPAKSKTNTSEDSAEHSGYAQSFVVFIVGECSPSKNCSKIVWGNHRYLNISWDLIAIWLPCWFNKGKWHLHQLAWDQDRTNLLHSLWFLRVFQCVCVLKCLQSVQAGQAFSLLIEQWIG